MKTRVIRMFDCRNGIDVYWVQKWALWDPPDLRQAFPDQYDWRHTKAYHDRIDATKAAERLSMGKEINPEVIIEFDSGAEVNL